MHTTHSSSSSTYSLCITHSLPCSPILTVHAYSTPYAYLHTIHALLTPHTPSAHSLHTIYPLSIFNILTPHPQPFHSHAKSITSFCVLIGIVVGWKQSLYSTWFMYKKAGAGFNLFLSMHCHRVWGEWRCKCIIQTSDTWCNHQYSGNCFFSIWAWDIDTASECCCVRLC